MDNLNPDLRKVKELALKLKEMADRGTEHERVVAEKKLTSLLNKYGLKLKDIQENKTKLRTFTFKHEDEAMVVAHVIWSVVPNLNVERTGRQKKALCKLNTEQYIEVKEKLKFYLLDYANQKKSFTIAYICKNNLEVKEHVDTSIDIKSVSNLIRGISEADFKPKKGKKLII